MKKKDILNIINKNLRKIARYRCMRGYKKKINEFKRINPNLFKPLNPEIENSHKRYWKKLKRNIDVSWLRYYSNISGIKDKRYMPEDIYYTIIEKRLNDINYSWIIADKNSYEKFFEKEIFPTILFRNINGSFLDKYYNFISKKEFSERLSKIKEDFIIKPSIESGGGKNVKLLFYKNNKFYYKDGNEFTLKTLQKQFKADYVIQKVIKQHDFCSQFNKSSVNTLRIFTYRSVKNNKIIPLKCVLRMGQKGMWVDNQTSGGISCYVSQDGKLNSFALTRYGDKYYYHPDSKVKFKGLVIPFFSEIIKLVSKLAQKIPSHRLLGFDVTITSDNQIKVIEINSDSQDINFLQTCGGPLFGGYTEEILKYCQDHKERDNFEVLRPYW